MKLPCRVHFVISDRKLDSEILDKRKLPFTALPVRPLAMGRPWTWPMFWRAWQVSVAASLELFERAKVAAVIATGGFVAAPVVAAAHRAGIPAGLVSLDAVPGKANNWLAARASDLFTVYPVETWPDARRIGLPLPRASYGPENPAEARQQLNLDPTMPTLLITGGSQGAETINLLTLAMLKTTSMRTALHGWQALHLAGPGAEKTTLLADLREAYEAAGIPARVETFCNAMGLAWSAATIAICRAGAGTVAEVQVNGVPSIFLPYPFHKDEHQRRNAEPLVQAGAGLMFKDLIDAQANARQLQGPLTALIRNPSRREHMSERLRDIIPGDGADILARWINTILTRPPDTA